MLRRRAFKTDESFLEKIAIGAVGTRGTFEHLAEQGHQPIELERGSMSFKIWKAIKIKRVRVPDILCLRCGQRVESRAKTKIAITMSHSFSDPQRGWDFGLEDDDYVAFVHCQRTGESPIAWTAGPLVQYARVRDLREAWRAGQVAQHRPKGAQEGFEARVTWPAASASSSGTVEEVSADFIRLRRQADGRAMTVVLSRKGGRLTPLVRPGDAVHEHQVVAAIVPVSAAFPCRGGANLETYLRLARSISLSDRYTSVKALGRFDDRRPTEALAERVQDGREHIYVRVDAAAGLMRRADPRGRAFLAETLHDAYLENRLEAAIILGEVATPEATHLLIETLQSNEQDPEIRAGAAWSLGEIASPAALEALLQSFAHVADPIKVEAARALAKLARKYRAEVISALPQHAPEERPRIAWALSKAGGFTIHDLLPTLIDEDARHWIAYVIGTQARDALLPQIEDLAKRDPQVYFAVTVLWKIMASWVYDLDEY